MKILRSTSRRPELLLDLIALDRNSHEPLHRQLYLRLVELIMDGSLPFGGRLPSSRALAQKINVSRNTVVSAYQQLEVEGYVQAQRGSQTFVAAAPNRCDNASNRGTGRREGSVVQARTADDLAADEFFRSGAPAFASTRTSRRHAFSIRHAPANHRASASGGRRLRLRLSAHCRLSAPQTRRLPATSPRREAYAASRTRW